MGIFELPESYTEIRRVNPQKDKKLAILSYMLAREATLIFIDAIT